MSNYCCTVRTNYFRVKDENVFYDLMNNVQCYEGCILIMTKESESGDKLFGFGCESNICGYVDSSSNESEEVEADYDRFILELQKCVAEGDAVIIFEVGNDNLRYVVGQAMVVTSNKSELLDISSLAKDKAANMLENEDWDTECEY